MPFQGDRFASMITQGAALGSALLPFQGDRLASIMTQGNALGIVAVSKAPCKGKSLINCLVL